MPSKRTKLAPPSGPAPEKIDFALFTEKWWPGLAFIVLATLLAYSPVFSAGFIWDDDAYVTGNPMLTAPDGWWRIWFSAHHQSQYFPLVYSTFRLEYDLWGLNPRGYHMVNVYLHIANALLVWHLLRRLAMPGAWLAAAIFALHPVQVESVAWVTELKNTESTLFYLLAMLAWLKFCAGRSRWFYAVALLLYLLALFAKTTACTLPAVLLLVLWVKGEPVGRRVVQVIPFALLGVAMGLLSVWWENHLDNYDPRVHLIGGFADRLLVATRAVWFYAGKIFFPARLVFSYPRWNINAADPRQYLWLAACLLAGAGLWWQRRRWGRVPLAAALFFVSVLSPMLGFIPLYTFYYSYVADHYQYLACLGLITAFSLLFARLALKYPARRASLWTFAIALLAALGLLTNHQCQAYQNLETLWFDTLTKNPRSAMAAYNYGTLMAQEGRLDLATAYYQLALKNDPAKAVAHNNLGIVLCEQSATNEAIVHFRDAVALRPDVIGYHCNLAWALETTRQTNEAVAELRRALELDPGSAAIKSRLEALGASVK